MCCDFVVGPKMLARVDPTLDRPVILERKVKENRQLEISEISAAVKAPAKELNIPIIV
jgi:hypothetical protein